MAFSILIFDLFAQSVELRFKNDRKIRNSKGLGFTLILVTIFVLTGIYFGRELMKREYPFVVTSEIHERIPPMFQIGTEQVPLAFTFLDVYAWTPYIDESIFIPRISYTFSYYKMIDGVNTFMLEESQAKAELCEKDKHFRESDIDHEWIDKLPFGSLYCLPLNNQNEIGGNIDISDTKFVSIEIQACRDDHPFRNPDIPCAQSSQMQERLKNNYFQIYFGNKVFDPTKNPPVTTVGQTVYTTISPDYKQEIDMRFNMISATIDQGYVLEDLQQFIGLELGTNREMSLNQGNLLLRLFMSLSFEKSNFVVSYQKVQQLTAQLGGVISLLMGLIVLVLSPFLIIDFHSKFMEQIFEIKKHNPQITKDQYQRRVQNNQKEINDLMLGQSSFSDQDNNGASLQPINPPTEFNDANLHSMPTNSDKQSKQRLQANEKNEFDNNNLEMEKSSNIIELDKQYDQKIQTITNIIQDNIRDQIAQSAVRAYNSPVSYNKTFNDKKPRQSTLTQMKSIILNTTKQINNEINCCDKLQVMFGLPGSNHNLKLYRLATSYIDQTVDILYITKQLAELDKIKAILFDQPQLQLFNMLSKPIIHCFQQNDEMMISSIEENFGNRNMSEEDQIQEGFEAFQILRKQSDPKTPQGVTNLRLFSTVQYHTLQLFEQYSEIRQQHNKIKQE